MLFVPAAEFANGAAQSGLLTLEETNEIFLYYTAQKKPSLNFPVVKRKGLMPQCCHRFQSSAYRSNQWRYRYIIIPRASHLEVHWSFIDTLFVVYCSGDAAMPFSLLLTSEFSLLALVCMDHRMVLQNTWLVFIFFSSKFVVSFPTECLNIFDQPLRAVQVRIELKRSGTIVGERETNFKSDGKIWILSTHVRKI